MSYSILSLFLVTSIATPLVPHALTEEPTPKIVAVDEDDDDDSGEDDAATSSAPSAKADRGGLNALPAVDKEEQSLSFEAEGIAYGDVHIFSADAEIPVGKGWTLLAGTDLIRTRERGRTALRPYAQAGFGLSLARAWRLEALGEYGPTTFNLGRLGASLALVRSDPKLDLRAEISVRRYWWADGQGPAGAHLFQSNAELSETINLGRWRVALHQNVFSYDRSLIAGRDELDGLTELAREGSYAPSWVVGVTGRFQATDWLTPFVAIDEIAYAADVGSGTLLSVGAEIEAMSWLRLRPRAGALYNRFDPDLPVDNGWLPVIGLAISLP